MLRAGDVLVERWVDRLGRNYADVTDAIREFIRRGVIVRTVINGLTFDGATKDPMQMAVRDAMIAFMAVNVGNRIAVAVPSQCRRVPVSECVHRAASASIAARKTKPRSKQCRAF